MPRRIKVNQNFIDKAINYLNPVAGARRLRARAVMEVAGGWFGGDKGRRRTEGWNPATGDADEVIQWDIDTLRERSHDLYRNAPAAASAINTNITHTIGVGLRVRPQIDRDFLGLSDEEADEVEAAQRREWLRWSISKECDIQRTSNFDEIAETAFRATLLSGDIFVSSPFKERIPGFLGLKVQLIEGERVSNEGWQSDTERLVGGVEKDEFGAPVNYHISKAHPGSTRDRKVTEWEVIPVFNADGERQILHLYDKLWPNQTRGVPYLAPVIETFKQIDRLIGAEIDAAVINSFFTVFIKTSTEDGLDTMEPTSAIGGKSSDKDYKMGSGNMLDLALDEEVEFADPKRPNDAMDDFLVAILRLTGASLGIPFEILIQHFTASYSASRAAVEMAFRFFQKRRVWIINNLYQPFYEKVISEAVARGRLSAPGFFADPEIRAAYLGAAWRGPAKIVIQEHQEVRAARGRIDMGISNKSRETAVLLGEDWEEVHQQRVKEIKKEQEDGMVQEPPPEGDEPDPEREREREREDLDDELKRAAVSVLKAPSKVARFG